MESSLFPFLTKIYSFLMTSKEPFRHSKYHPNITGAFSFVIENYLIVSLEQIFGSLVSPQIWKPLARVCTHLAAAISHRRDLLAKHHNVISKVEFSPKPDHQLTFTYVVKDRSNHHIIQYVCRWLSLRSHRICHKTLDDRKCWSFVYVCVISRHPNSTRCP